MVRISRVKNAKIQAAFEAIAKKSSPLTDEEYKLLEKKYRAMRTVATTVKFDDGSDMIVARIPDSLSPVPREMKDGTQKVSVPVILADENWANFLLDPVDDHEDLEAIETHKGCTIVLVGRINERERDGKTFRNIVGIRGLIIIEPDDGDDEIDV